MALVRTTLANVDALTTGAFTPADGSLIVVCFGAIGNSDSGMRGGDLTISNTAGLTTTSRINSTGSSGWSYGGRIWTAPVTTGVSMTVTCGSSVGSVNVAPKIVVYQYTGQHATPTGFTAATSVAATASGAQSTTLSNNPQSSSEVIAMAIGAVNSGTVNIDEGSGFTESIDSPFADQRRFQLQTRTGSTSTNVPWASVSNGGSVTSLGIELIALEIVSASGGGGGPTLNSNFLLLGVG